MFFILQGKEVSSLLRVLLAINHPQLVDQFYRESNLEITPASDVCYREAVMEAVRVDRPDVLVLSAFLDGAIGYPEIIFAARENNARIIFLAGSLEEGDPLLSEAARLGVYDFVFNPATLKKILHHLEHPARFSDAAGYLKSHLTSPRPQSPRQAPGGGPFRENENSPDSQRTGFLDRLRTRATGKLKDEREITPARDSEGDESAWTKYLSAEEKGGQKEGGALFESPKENPAGAAASPGGGGAGKVTVEGSERLLRSQTQYYQPSLMEQRARWQGPAPGGGPAGNNSVPAHAANGKSVAVACWSPAPAGKTFVAVNLSVTAAVSGERAALLDLDLAGRAVYTWLNITDHPASVTRLLGGEPGECARFRDLAVYGADPVPALDAVSPPEGMTLGELLRLVAPQNGFVVLDMPRELSSWHREIMDSCSAVVVVADPDCHNYLKLCRFSDQFKDCILVVNKHVRLSGPLDYKNLCGVDPAVSIPLLGKVYDSILFGEPLVSSDADLFKLFTALYQKIRQRGREIIVPEGAFQAGGVT